MRHDEHRGNGNSRTAMADPGSVGNGALADALAGAKKEKPKTSAKPTKSAKPKPAPIGVVVAVAPAAPTLAELLAEPVVALDVAAVAAEAAATKAQGIEAAKTLKTLGDEIAKIESALRQAKGDETLRQLLEPTLAQLRGRQSAIMAAVGTTGHLAEQTRLDLLLSKIRSHPTTDHKGAIRLMDEAIASGRCFAPTYAEAMKSPKDRSGKLWAWDRMVYFVLGPDGKMSPGNRALYAEFDKLFSAVEEEHQKYIRMAGLDDLTGLEKGKAGFYTLYSPEYRPTPKFLTTAQLRPASMPPLEAKPAAIRRSEKLRSVAESALLIQVEVVERNGRQEFVNINLLDAYGFLRWVVEDPGCNRIPWFWFEKGRVLLAKDPKTGRPRRLEKDDFYRRVKIVNILRALVQGWRYRAACKAVEATALPAPEPPATAITPAAEQPSA